MKTAVSLATHKILLTKNGTEETRGLLTPQGVAGMTHGHADTHFTCRKERRW